MDKYFRPAAGYDSQLAERLAVSLGISPVTAAILQARGIQGESQARRFINYGADNLLDPFLLSGMQQAVDIINRHIESGSSIVIYGDYDADGICSVSILYLYLKERGANAAWYIPERDEGYGLNTEAIEYIIGEYSPNLIITVDCGVTAVAEAEYIKQRGIELIITDHHNRQTELPGGIIINPKLSPQYPFSELCGAGVALKVVQALSGKDKVLKYIDIAAIATVADSVVLCGENRDIAGEGIRRLNAAMRPGIKKLCASAQIEGEINAYTVAFGIVPRINAAGRIGEAKRAVALFCEEDETKLEELAAELNAANAERQQLCEDIINACERSIAKDGSGTLHVISVVDGNGQAGVSGIVASKLCERYYRPAFVFCRTEDGLLKGSGRSIEGIDIFEMLSAMPHLFVRFGGHAYAAGVTIAEDKYLEFVKSADKYLSRTELRPLFVKRQYYDFDLTGQEINREFIDELELFEPCGVANPRPRFLTAAQSLNAQPLQKYPQHLSFRLSGAEIMAFGYGKHVDVFNYGGALKLLLDFKVNKFAGREYAKGYLKDFGYADTCAPIIAQKAAANYIMQLGFNAGIVPSVRVYAERDMQGLLDKTQTFGTLFVAFCPSVAQRLVESYPALSALPVSLFSAENSSNVSRLLIAPDPNCDIRYYDRLIFLDRPLSASYIAEMAAEKEVYLNADAPAQLPSYLDIDLSREALGRYYRIISQKAVAEKPFTGISSLYNAIKKRFADCSILMLSICLSVFSELGLFCVREDEPIKIVSGEKFSLEDSLIYQKLKKLTAKKGEAA